MRDQIYEVTLPRQLSLLSSMAFIHGVVLAAYFFSGRFTLNMGLLIVYLIFFVFDALPTIILHLQYLSANRYTTLVVRDQLRTLTYRRQGVHHDYSFDDIDQITYVAGYGNGAWYSFSDYRYFVLVFKDGKKVLISSLMIKFSTAILERMFGIKINTVMRFYPFVRKRIDLSTEV